MNDSICKTCINFKKKCCAGECPPIHWINGKTARQEPLAEDILNSNIPADRDYNTIIAEISEDRQHKIDRLLAIPDKRTRAIAILLQANYSQADVSSFFKLSVRQIYNIINK